MYRIGRYRRKVVRENLKKSFPEKDKKERTVIHVEVNEKHYYFGSLAAIYEVFDSKTLGIGYGALRNVGLSPQKPYQNNYSYKEYPHNQRY